MTTKTKPLKLTTIALACLVTAPALAQQAPLGPRAQVYRATMLNAMDTIAETNKQLVDTQKQLDAEKARSADLQKQLDATKLTTQ